MALPEMHRDAGDGGRRGYRRGGSATGIRSIGPSHFLGLPEQLGGLRLHPGEDFVPPVEGQRPPARTAAVALGLDGTFIILGGVSSRGAAGAAGQS